MMKQPLENKLKKIFNGAVLACASATVISLATYIDIHKDYGSPPSQFKEYEQKQIDDVHNALRSIFIPIAVIGAAVAVGARRRQNKLVTNSI